METCHATQKTSRGTEVYFGARRANNAFVRVSVSLPSIFMKNSNNTHGVIQHLRALILAASEGAQLPSVRELMGVHRVGPATVQQAFALLAGEGLIEPRPGQGTFVRKIST